jgi:hypothetical protein
MRCFIVWLRLNRDSQGMLDDKMKMSAHYERTPCNNAEFIFQQAVNEDPELFDEAQAQITAAV